MADGGLHRNREPAAGPVERQRASAAAHEKLRRLPPVHGLLETEAARALLQLRSRQAVTRALRRVLDEARQYLLDPARGGTAPAPDVLLARAAALLDQESRPLLRRVINATGIVLHTNLGRAPLAAEAVAAVADSARGYVNLEFDLDAGERGSRYGNIEGLLRELTGAEAAVVVNNNAAAVLLALSALAAGGEVLVSRGELVEIGGSFRVPDVIGQGGARLVEVGTTNKTRLSDYRDAITAQTRAVLRVHPSNYRIVGFTAAPSVAELAGLARQAALPLIEDLGSGSLLDLRPFGLPHEPTVGESVAAGADIVCFSGDKLLGGPQAGLLVGTARAIAPLRRHPLLRAVRIDKLSLAALEATLRLYLDPETASRRLPVLAMLTQDDAALRTRAERLCTLLLADGIGDARVEAARSFAGGGSLPGAGLPTHAVSLALPGLATAELARRLRVRRPAVVGRIVADRLLFDMLTVAEVEMEEIVAAVRAVAAP